MLNVRVGYHIMYKEECDIYVYDLCLESDYAFKTKQ